MTNVMLEITLHIAASATVLFLVIYLFRRQRLSFRLFQALMTFWGMVTIGSFIVLMGTTDIGASWICLSMFPLAGALLGFQGARVIRDNA